MASNNSEIAQWVNDFIDDTMMETVAIASKIGEDALKIAREEHIYKAQTGNLQSSCGFAVTYDGETITRTGFSPAPGTSGTGADGSKKGSDYLDQCLEDRLSKGVSLTMVAGMDYAGYVEDKGLDVLKSAEAHIVQEFDKLAKGLI